MIYVLILIVVVFFVPFDRSIVAAFCMGWILKVFLDKTVESISVPKGGSCIVSVRKLD